MPAINFYRITQALVAFILVLFLASTAAAEDKKITVFAAASLRNALTELGDNFQKETGIKVVLSLASSNLLAKQIISGAPADIFISADILAMDLVAVNNAIYIATRQNILSNKLVVIAPNNGPDKLALTKEDFAKTLANDGKIAIGDPAGVPVGKYTLNIFQQLGLWDTISPHAVYGDNVTAVLTYVTSGNANLGVVYSSDLKGQNKAKIVASLPDNPKDPILYQAGIVRGHDGIEVKQFFDYLWNDKSSAVFRNAGFIPLPRKSTR